MHALPELDGDRVAGYSSPVLVSRGAQRARRGQGEIQKRESVQGFDGCERFERSREKRRRDPGGVEGDHSR